MPEISYKKWVKRGGMLFATEALGADDPDHPYNQVKAQGVRPEDYGMRNPYAERFEGQTRGELISRIIELEKLLEDDARNVHHRI